MGFSPSPGRIISYAQPGGPGIRVDSALYSGYTIPEYYDSLIAKVAAWGASRLEAISRLSAALDEIVIDGISTTVPVQRAILSNSAFRRGELDTHFIERHLKLRFGPTLSGDEAAALSAAVASSLGIVQMAAPAGSYRATPQQTKWAINARHDAVERRPAGASRHFEAI